LDKALDGVSNAGFKVTKTASAVNSGLSGIGRSAGQAGIQIQQFVGQIQGGQSALLALSQQGADLGFVLGAPLAGAIIGISSSIVSFLIPSIANTKSSIEQLNDVATELKDTLEETGDGTKKLSENLLTLARRSESLARIEIAKSIIDLEKASETAFKGIREELLDTTGFFTNFGDEVRDVAARAGGSIDSLVDGTKTFDQAIKDFELRAGDPLLLSSLRGQVDTLAERFDITKEQALQLGLAISNFTNDKDLLSAKSLESTISDISDTVDVSNKKFIELAASLTPFFNSITDGTNNINLLRQAFSDINKTIENEGVLETGDGAFNYLFDIGQTEGDAQLIVDIIEGRNERLIEAQKLFAERVNELGLNTPETIEEQLAREVEINRLALEQKLIDEETFRKRQAELSERYSKDQIKQAQGRTKAEQKIERNNASALLSIAQALANGNDDISKALFLTSQAYSASEVFFSTQAAAVKAIEVLGPVAGPPVAAQIETSGALRIAAIAAQTFGSLTGGSSGSGGTISATTATATETAQDFTPETSSLELTEQDEGGVQTLRVVFDTADGENLLDALATGIDDRRRTGR
jgi:hypothetical protein